MERFRLTRRDLLGVPLAAAPFAILTACAAPDSVEKTEEPDDAATGAIEEKVEGSGSPRILWQKSSMVSGGGQAFKSISGASKDIVLKESDDEEMVALDTRTGRKIWGRPKPEFFLGRRYEGIILISEDRELLGIEEKTGKKLWGVPFLDRSETVSFYRPLDADGAAWCLTGPNTCRIVAVGKDGRVLWKKEFQDRQNWVNTTKFHLVVSSADGKSSVNLQRLSQKDGGKVWERKLAGYQWGEPAAVPMFVVGQGDRMAAMNLDAGETLWEKEGRRVFSTVKGDIMLLLVKEVGQKGSYEMIDIKRGSLIYSFDVNSPLNHRAVKTAELDDIDTSINSEYRNFYVRDVKSLEAYDLRTGKFKWKADFESGRILEFGNGMVVAIDLSPPAGVRMRKTIVGLSSETGKAKWFKEYSADVTHLGQMWGFVYLYEGNKRVFIDPTTGERISELPLERGVKPWGWTSIEGGLVVETYGKDKSNEQGIVVMSRR